MVRCRPKIASFKYLTSRILFQNREVKTGQKLAELEKLSTIVAILTFCDVRNGVSIQNCEGGIKISQDGRSFIARRWKLTDDLKCVLSVAAQAGLTKLWQHGNPIGSESGRICFSSSHEANSWIFALGLEACPPDLQRFTFPRRLKPAFEFAAWEWSQQSGGHRNILVPRGCFREALTSVLQAQGAVAFKEVTEGRKKL